MTDYITVDQGNLDREHICCAISGAKHADGLAAKKAFLRAGCGQGLVFHKLNERGKVFIEYAPAEYCWRPVVAPGALVIHCLWVSGKFKGQGFGRELLDYAKADIGDRTGIAAVASKQPFLTDTKFYLSQGFEVVDRTEDGHDLVWFAVGKNAGKPRFADSVKARHDRYGAGVTFEYSHQCPFTLECIDEMSGVAEAAGFPVTLNHLASPEQAQNAASPFGTFGIFLDGRFLTHQLMSGKGFAKLLEKETA